VSQELRRRQLDLYTWSQPDAEVDFLVREDRRVSRLIQVSASLDTPETVSREYGALYKASAATRCRDLLLLTLDGAAPSKLLIPKGPSVSVRAVWEWLLER
jgi:predicted AAA+ superfamily ATPase